ncbi:hypothetical protein [Rubrivivax gelatinosus]|uniref:Uncharacterized protein n=1 Tax=Rubrivivax gelatinosus (strain NBRC 100245 / IL144) TaxID=983917 RepID=I0HU68_RUBGI|nr:hypothetical protein [Rubrivivax gelatinosus]BAL96555.1 hypothetical protein RGE_32160 [Rubrivivax gelatinosus IL144]
MSVVLSPQRSCVPTLLTGDEGPARGPALREFAAAEPSRGESLAVLAAWLLALVVVVGGTAQVAARADRGPAPAQAAAAVAR